MYTFFSKNQCSAEKILGLVGMMIKQIFSEQFVDWYIGFNILLRPLSVRIPTSVFCQEPIRNFDVFSDGQVRL